MPKPRPLTRENLTFWKERLGRITEASERRFGSMTPPAMFRHLRRTLETVLGDFPPPEFGIFLTRNAAFRALFLAMPWPKGKVKAPDWMTPAADGDLEHERAQLFAAFERFVALHEKNPMATVRNPLLGDVTFDYNSRLQGKHLEHHCEQFGV
ncbi:hypothetical protein GC173_15370 [bacterium]|nr:hypothetical protein [bacterium]